MFQPTFEVVLLLHVVLEHVQFGIYIQTFLLNHYFLLQVGFIKSKKTKIVVVIEGVENLFDQVECAFEEKYGLELAVYDEYNRSPLDVVFSKNAVHCLRLHEVVAVLLFRQ